MKSFLTTIAKIVLVSAIGLAGCKQSMVISRVDYSQSIESVLKPDQNGMVEDVQHGLKFSIMPLQYAETQDTSSVTTKQIRYIRGAEGYYYITAPDYKNVYVMAPQKDRLRLEKKIQVSNNGVQKPAFNQRTSYIQLLDRKSGESWRLNAKGIQKEEKQMAKNEGK
ncbi:MAG TPA: hypothetical protein VJ964_11690 [Balneolaceae bacterium]|nr:hypothetical protein [Balneolaceae bacterium]